MYPYNQPRKSGVLVNDSAFKKHDKSIYITLENGRRAKVAAVGVNKFITDNGKIFDPHEGGESLIYPSGMDAYSGVYAIKARSTNEYGTAVVSMASLHETHAKRDPDGSIVTLATDHITMTDSSPTMLFNTDEYYLQCALKLNKLGVFTGYVDRIGSYLGEKGFPDYDSLALYDAVAMGTTMMFPSANARYLAYAINTNPFAFPVWTPGKSTSGRISLPFVSVHMFYEDIYFSSVNINYPTYYPAPIPGIGTMFVVLYGKCVGGGLFKKTLCTFRFHDLLYKSFTQDFSYLNDSLKHSHLGLKYLARNTRYGEYYVDFPMPTMIVDPDPPREKIEISYDDFTAPVAYQ
jgi:hypothetical protein